MAASSTTLKENPEENMNKIKYKINILILNELI
jgi:hypothetical protein